METLRTIQLPLRPHPAVDNDPMELNLDDADLSLYCFLMFPAEIRNLIYQLLLTSSAVPALRRRAAQNHCSPYLVPRPPICPAILSTCKQINAEATPILYTLNTFAASPTLLTSLPFLVSPTRPIVCPGVTSSIKRWYINVRLDCDPRFTEEDVTRAFTGVEELEVEATEAMYRSAGTSVLMLFKGVRGVGNAKVGGSVERQFAEWLEDAMMSALGSEVEEFEDGPEKRLVGGVPEVFDIWRHANR